MLTKKNLRVLSDIFIENDIDNLKVACVMYNLSLETHIRYKKEEG
jgi:hypothetical protein